MIPIPTIMKVSLVISLLGCTSAKQSTNGNWYKLNDEQVSARLQPERVIGLTQNDVEKYFAAQGFDHRERRIDDLYFNDVSWSKNRRNLGQCDHQIVFRNDSSGFVEKITSIAVIFENDLVVNVLLQSQFTGP